MDSISYTSLRQNLRKVMDAVVNDSTAYEIKRTGHEPVVMMSKHDYEAMQETLYLLSSPKNAGRLHESLEQAKKGKLTDLDDA